MIPLKKNQLGFTLPELLIVVGMISILTAVSIPVMTANIPRFELKGAVRTLIADFQKAKIEAVKRNCNVEIRFYPEPVPVAAEKLTAGGNGSYQLVALDDNSVVLSRNMPKYVTLYLPSFTLVPQTPPAQDYYKAGYKPQGLPLVTGSVYLVNSKATSYKLSLSAAGYVSTSMSQVDLGSLSAW